MAFTVEDGSVVVGANSYNTVVAFQTHHVDRAQIDLASEFLDAEIQAALILATDYVDKRFGRRFRGYKQTRDQELEWPRIDACDNDDYTFEDIPRQLKKAINEYALIVLRLERGLAPIPGLSYATIDITTGETTSNISGRVTSKTEKVVPIEESTSYDDSTSSKSAPTSKMSVTVSSIPEYPQADLWIEELLVSGTSRRLVLG
jgi:hypothetical protein